MVVDDDHLVEMFGVCLKAETFDGGSDTGSLISGGDEYGYAGMASPGAGGKRRNSCPCPAIILDQCPIDDKEAAAYEREKEDRYHFGVDMICKYRGNAGAAMW
jgi:hypothetical protein